MQAFFRFFINFLYIIVIIFVVISVSTYAFLQKSNEASRESQIIAGKILKQEILQLATTQGYINTLDVTTGDTVADGDLIAKITAEKETPTISKAPAKDEEEEQTSSTVINASDNGVIQKTLVKVGQKVEKDQAIVNILSNENIQVTLKVNEENYKKIKQLKDIYFYSKRLDQSFAVKPSLLNPSVMGATNGSTDSYEVNFVFIDPKEGVSLLQNERMELVLPAEQKPNVIKEFFSGLIK